MNVLKKIVSDNRSTEHFDKVIDILMSTGLSEIDAIKLFNMAVRESIPDDDEAGEQANYDIENWSTDIFVKVEKDDEGKCQIILVKW